jgi:hypothetical protein
MRRTRVCFDAVFMVIALGGGMHRWCLFAAIATHLVGRAVLGHFVCRQHRQPAQMVAGFGMQMQRVAAGCVQPCALKMSTTIAASI